MAERGDLRLPALPRAKCCRADPSAGVHQEAHPQFSRGHRVEREPQDRGGDDGAQGCGGQHARRRRGARGKAHHLVDGAQHWCCTVSCCRVSRLRDRAELSPPPHPRSRFESELSSPPAKDQREVLLWVLLSPLPDPPSQTLGVLANTIREGGPRRTLQTHLSTTEGRLLLLSWWEVDSQPSGLAPCSSCASQMVRMRSRTDRTPTIFSQVGRRRRTFGRKKLKTRSEKSFGINAFSPRVKSKPASSLACACAPLVGVARAHRARLITTRAATSRGWDPTETCWRSSSRWKSWACR